MGDTKIPFPTGGLNDNWAQSTQPSDTTPDSRNMRSVDDTTGRTRGAKRSGMSKHFDDLAAAAPVRFATTIVYDNKTITYEALEGELDSFGAGLEKLSEVWAEKTKPNLDAKNVDTDFAGNVFTLSGATVEKHNPDGLLLWSFAIPLEVPTHVLGPLVVADDLGVYVAVESGSGGSKGAAVYRIGQSPVANSNDTEPVLDWTWTTNRWNRELRVVNGLLYILEQDDEQHASVVESLTNVQAAIPLLASAVSVPYPSTCMVVKGDGAVVTGHPYQLDRDSLLKYPGVGIPLEAWTPEDAPEGSFEVWADLRAEDIGLDDGESVFSWLDRSGNGRHLYQGSQPNGDKVAIEAPTFRAKGSTGQPSVEFDGTQGLFSVAGGGTYAQSDACKSLIPNHGDGAFCVMILCRPATSKASDEVNDVGADVDSPRWLFDQLHHSHFEGSGAGAANFDQDYTEAHRSSLIVNSKGMTGSGEHYTWSGKDDVKHGIHSPGYVRALTSSSGYNLTGSDATGSTDAAFMPANRGAAWAAWPKEAQFDDATADSPGEGLTVLTFMNGGGLDECEEIAGSYDSTLFHFTMDDPDQLNRLQANAAVTLWINGQSSAGTYVHGSGVITTAGFAPPLASGSYTGHVVLPRNDMTRSMLRAAGVTSDRWEALPMSYAGADGLLAPDAVFNKNVTANVTGVGYPMADGTLKGFKGEIMQILVLGRRKPNSDRVDLGGTLYHEWPTVVEHPLWAANQRTGEAADPAYASTSTNLDSTILEKLEGWMVHRHGVAKKLQALADTYPHPHYPATTVQTFDIPLVSLIDESGQAWLPRKRFDEAMVIKHDASGKMIWCLLADTGSGYGDIFSEDLNGNPGVLGVSNARCTGGLALGLDGAIYVAGPGSGTNNEEFAFGVIYDLTDDDQDLPLRSVGWWYISGTVPPNMLKLGYQADVTIRIVSDEFGNLFAPVPPGTTYLGAVAPDAMRAFSKDGGYLFRLTTLGGGGSAPYQNGYAVALPPVNPDYHI